MHVEINTAIIARFH